MFFSGDGWSEGEIHPSTRASSDPGRKDDAFKHRSAVIYETPAGVKGVSLECLLQP